MADEIEDTSDPAVELGSAVTAILNGDKLAIYDVADLIEFFTGIDNLMFGDEIIVNIPEGEL